MKNDNLIEKVSVNYPNTKTLIKHTYRTSDNLGTGGIEYLTPLLAKVTLEISTIEAMTASTYQAVSGAGREGIEELEGQIKAEAAVRYLPHLRKREEFPLTAPFVATVIVCIRFLPAVMLPLRIPQNLRVRTNQKKIAPAFQFLLIRSINYLIVFPLISNPHTILRLLCFLL